MFSKRELCIWLLSIIVLWSLLWGCLWSLPAAEPVFQWSPAADHHASVVIVKCGGSSGSGCYVQAGDVRGVLTARHCVGVSGPVHVLWPDGSQTTGEVTTDRTGADVAMILTRHDTIQPLLIAEAAPQPGEWLEFCGYGGERDQLRHWWGRFADAAARDQSGNAFASYRCSVLQGDSGGPILTRANQVVGVITVGGGQPIARSGAAMAFASTGGPAYDVVYQFASRVNQRYRGLFIGGVAGCGPSGCGPYSGGGNWAYPPPQPRPTPTPMPSPGPSLAPSQPQQVPCPGVVYQVDYERLAGCLAPLLAADPKLRGEPGPAGPAGPAGAAATLTPEQLDRLAQLLAADPRVRGPAGPPGPAGTSATVDVDRLATSVAGRLPPIYFRVVDSDGRQLTPVEPIRLGEGFTFRVGPGKQ